MNRGSIAPPFLCRPFGRFANHMAVCAKWFRPCLARVGGKGREKADYWGWQRQKSTACGGVGWLYKLSGNVPGLPGA